ncbi:hypothetical protein D3C85_1745530 [compost metagenome]
MSSTSLIRSAEAEARGINTNIMDTIIRENIICIAYWIKAISEPTCRSPSPIRIPP